MTVFSKVYLIGAGPGDPDLITLRALRLLERADVVVHDRLVSPEILKFCRSGARMLPVGKAPNRHPVPQDRINEILLEEARKGHQVVRLKGGDPLIFGRGSEEAAYLARHDITVEYVPGITAAQGMSTSLGVPLTHRGLASGVMYITGHRQAGQPLDLDWKKLANPDMTLVIYMGLANIGQIAMGLMAHGLADTTPVMAVSNATSTNERHLLSRLDRITSDVRAAKLTTPVLFVIGKVVSLASVADDVEPADFRYHSVAAHA